MYKLNMQYDIITIFDNIVIPKMESYKWHKIFSDHCQVYGGMSLNLIKEILVNHKKWCKVVNLLYKDNMEFIDDFYKKNTVIQLTFEIYNFSNKIEKNANELRKKFKICTLMLPLIVFHTFNIIFGENNVAIYQSWYRTIKYQKIYDFTYEEFNDWIKQLNEIFLNIKKVKDVFDNFEKLKKLFKYEKQLINKQFVTENFSESDNIEININIEGCHFEN